MRVKRFEGLNAFPAAYDAVFRRGSHECFFVSLPWFRLFEQLVLERNERAVIYGVEEVTDGDDPLAALVLRETREPHGLWSATKLESLANYYTPLYAVPGADGDRANAIVGTLCDALRIDSVRWDVLRLWPLDPHAAVFASFVSALRSAGMWVQTHFCFENWYLEVAGRSYTEYLQELPTVLRKNIPYSTRRLERTHRVTLEIVTEVGGLDQGLAHYECVYRSSWRPFESHPAFIRGLARLAAEQGALRLGLLYLDGEPAAVQIWVVHQGVASIYKICYDERFAKLSIGTVLTAKVMEHVIDVDRVRIVDYLSGDDAYKRNWMSHRRERWGIMAFNPRRVGGLLLAGRHIGGRAVKRAWEAVQSWKGIKRDVESPT